MKAMHSHPCRITSNIALLLLFLVQYGYGKKVNWHVTTSLSGGFDNNVLESVTTHNSDATNRFIFTFRGNGLLGDGVTTQLCYQGGLETYARHSKENRTIHQISGHCIVPFEKNIGFGIRLLGRWKAFFKNNRGYGNSHFSPYFKFTLGRKWMTSLSHTNINMNYETGENYDYNYQGYGIQLTCFISYKIRLDLQWNTGTTKFLRDAFIFSPCDSLWHNKGILQRDLTEKYAIHLEMLYWALMRIGFSFRKNNSNSYGHDYQIPKLNCMVVFYLPEEFSINLLGTKQWKHYQESLIPILQIRPDSENEENSHIVMDIAKDLTSKYTVRIRFGWYRNESPFRDQYYEKTVVSAGFSCEF
jgi:hypothetical protein